MVPRGWDTIPQRILKDKVRAKIDFGIYPLSQDSCFGGSYVLITFIPTMQALTAFDFKRITAEIDRMSEQSEIKSDTLGIRRLKSFPLNEDGKYTVSTYYEAIHRSDTLYSCQLLYLTKFGYISAFSYEQHGSTVSLEETVRLMRLAIVPQYPYTEPEKTGIGWKQILIAITIGLLVYFSMLYLPKLIKVKR
jgi:hypothetical protein